MKKSFIYIILTSVLLYSSCSANKTEYDATGVFEVTEITVSAEQTGKLLKFDVEEGHHVKAFEELGIIDTVQLYLKARQIGATKLIYQSQIPETNKQIAALKEQLKKTQQDIVRYENLLKDGAVNKKLLDDAKAQESVIQKQIDAMKSSLNISTNSLGAQINTADVQQLQIADQLQKCHIYSPISGVILEKYMEPGEFAVVGKPLFKVAELDHIFLRAYISAGQLTNLKIGQKVTVFADEGDSGRKAYKGTVSWITEKAEFTPKTIQTRDERANLVYAIKITVENDGYIKSGMYGEVKLH